MSESSTPPNKECQRCHVGFDPFNEGNCGHCAMFTDKFIAEVQGMSESSTPTKEARLRQFCAFIKEWKPNEALTDEIYSFAMAEGWMNLQSQKLRESHKQLAQTLKLADGLLSKCAALLYNEGMSNHIPYGLRQEVSEFVVGNLGGEALAKAKEITP